MSSGREMMAGMKSMDMSSGGDSAEMAGMSMDVNDIHNDAYFANDRTLAT